MCTSIYDRFSNRLTEIGQIKIGKRVDGKTTKLTHFEVIDMNGDKIAAIHEAYGAMPKKLTVMLPYDKPKNNMTVLFAMYQPTTAVKRCMAIDNDEGKEPMARREWNPDLKKTNIEMYEKLCAEFPPDEKGNLPEEIPCKGIACPYYKAKKCKLYGILSVMILHPDKKVPIPNRIGGIYKFRTTSWHSTSAILNSADMISQMSHQRALAGIPLTLELEYIKSQNKTHRIPRVTINYVPDDDAVMANVDFRKKVELIGEDRLVFEPTEFGSVEEHLIEIEENEEAVFDDVKETFFDEDPDKPKTPVESSPRMGELADQLRSAPTPAPQPARRGRPPKTPEAPPVPPVAATPPPPKQTELSPEDEALDKRIDELYGGQSKPSNDDIPF